MKYIIGITGASGSIYAKVLLEKLAKMSSQWSDIDLIFSDTGREVWKYEIGSEPDELTYRIHGPRDFNAPFASGSCNYNGLIICPCTMGTLGRIANGFSDDLLTRTADVMLKERRKLILVTRETPLNLIHINNMKLVTEAGGVILPASPSFYSKPQAFDDLAATVIDRVLILAGFKIENTPKWGD
jgi:4-hydroxy-3-polyprenylbenzoate decarboxylase